MRVCRGCGCGCDDLQLEMMNDQPVRVMPVCELAEKYYGNLAMSRPMTAEIGGQEVELEEALTAAVELLNGAKTPVVYGLSGASLRGQKEAIAVADRIGAVLDVAGEAWSNGVTLAVQQTGHAGCTLGEIRERADLVVFWGVDPVRTHPRFLSRFCAGVPLHGKRTLVVVDGLQNATRLQTPHFIPLKPSEQLDAILFLRGLCKERELSTALADETRSGLVKLAECMKTCQYGVICVGPGILNEGEETSQAVSKAQQICMQLSQLTTELNAVARFQWMPLGEAGGAEAVVNWQTGYPGHVSFASGHPIYSPSEYQLAALLDGQEVDACLMLGDRAWENVACSSRWQRQLSEIPTVALKTGRNAGSWQPAVCLPCAEPGVQTANTLFRMDGIPLPQTALLPQVLPSDAELLQRILARLTLRLPANNSHKS